MSTVFYDGACPLCSAEIAYYRGRDSNGRLKTIDVSVQDAPLPVGLSREKALGRLHVLSPEGELLSGARAFIALWCELPGAWRQVARLASLPGAPWILERCYRGFLIVRPLMVRAFCKVS